MPVPLIFLAGPGSRVRAVGVGRRHGISSCGYKPVAVVTGSRVVIGREQRLVTTVVINRQRYLEGRYYVGGQLKVTASASPQRKPTVKDQPDVCRTAALWNNLIVWPGHCNRLTEYLVTGEVYQAANHRDSNVKQPKHLTVAESNALISSFSNVRITGTGAPTWRTSRGVSGRPCRHPACGGPSAPSGGWGRRSGPCGGPCRRGRCGR